MYSEAFIAPDIPLSLLHGIFSSILCQYYFRKQGFPTVVSSGHSFWAHFVLEGSGKSDHFARTVNDLLLRMSIGGSGYLCCGRGWNLIAPSEQSQKTWLDLEPLLMFSICVVMTFLLTEIIPISFHVHRSLEIHAPVTATDYWLHSNNSEKEHNMLTLEKVKSWGYYFWEEGFSTHNY